MDRMTELFFPHRLIHKLRDLGGPQWRDLVDRVSKLPDTHEDSLAMRLMVIRTSGCVKCHVGSYKAGLGCVVCAQRAIRGQNPTDASLMRRFKRSQAEVREFLKQYGEQADKAA